MDNDIRERVGDALIEGILRDCSEIAQKSLEAGHVDGNLKHALLICRFYAFEEGAKLKHRIEATEILIGATSRQLGLISPMEIGLTRQDKGILCLPGAGNSTIIFGLENLQNWFKFYPKPYTFLPPWA